MHFALYDCDFGSLLTGAQASMALADLPLLAKLKTKMQWHQSRQSVLAQNVANSDTPGYRAKDIRAIDFSQTMAAVTAGQGIATRATDARHFQVAGLGGGAEFKTRKPDTFETTPEGNKVVLEEQMMKVTANQMDFQAAASLYERGLRMLKTAVSRR